MNTYYEDILSQPKELGGFLRHYEVGGPWEALKKLGKLSFRKVIFSGMGSSHFCSMTAELLLRRSGIDSSVVSAGELLYFERETLGEDVLLCLISQSGESGEIVRLIEELPQGVTGNRYHQPPGKHVGKTQRFPVSALCFR